MAEYFGPFRPRVGCVLTKPQLWSKLSKALCISYPD